VEHVLSGISASDYSSKKSSNDEMFKQTVVRMMGYDSTIDDVSILLVTTGVVFDRSLVGATVETDLLYSITSQTRIFNDTNQAIHQFMQALNKSITTGAFDTLLHT